MRTARKWHGTGNKYDEVKASEFGLTTGHLPLITCHLRVARRGHPIH